jgi:uncharacterized repeat protein (TIGR03803 family)
MQSKALRFPATMNRAIFLFLIFLLASVIAPARLQGQRFQVLLTFNGANGALPEAKLIRDGAGNLYGTTSEGGTGVCSNYGCGTAFKLDKTGQQVWLHSFNTKNGRTPAAGLLRDTSGNLYGTTVEGGDTTCFSLGCGTIFKLNPTGTEKLLYSFTGTPDGWFPQAPLVEDPEGNFYSTTDLGGSAGGYGAVVKLDSTGGETILHSFAGPPGGGGDGAYSYEGVIRDATGNLYGVTFEGGAYCCGSVYRIDTTGAETLLYSFTGGSDGSGPDSALLLDGAGNLYGTAGYGGNLSCGGGSGCGVIFELSPSVDGGWVETTLYTFCSLPGCADGQNPGGSLAQDSAGNLYGVTHFGGGSNKCVGGCGAVFRLSPSGAETILHSFTRGPDGGNPAAGVVLDGVGNLYGTAGQGGDLKCANGNGKGCGVVFKLRP